MSRRKRKRGLFDDLIGEARAHVSELGALTSAAAKAFELAGEALKPGNVRKLKRGARGAIRRALHDRVDELLPEEKPDGQAQETNPPKVRTP